jgi:hypothetical protein
MPGHQKRKRRRKQQVRDRPAEASAPPGDAHPQVQPGAKSKDEIAREQLVPLREGERPTPVTVAAVIAALIAVANVIGAIVGGSEAAGAIPFAVLMTVAAVGMWRARYWAVLGFQVILALTAISSIVFLVVQAEALLDIVIALVALAVSGTMFWLLVKSLARIQMPERAPR